METLETLKCKKNFKLYIANRLNDRIKRKEGEF